MIMAYVEVKKFGISGIMLDGHMPDFSELKKIDWDYTTEHKLSILPKIPPWQVRFEKYRKHLELDARNQPAIIRSTIYGKLIELFKRSYCPYMKRYTWPCKSWFNPSKGPDAMKYSFASHLGISPEEAYDIFNADAEADLSKGKGEYASLITVVDRRPETGCRIFRLCDRNWMDFLKFEPKKRKEHSDFETYKAAAKKVLIDHVVMMESHYFDDRRLSDFFG